MAASPRPLTVTGSKATCGRWTGGRLSTPLMAITFLLMAGLPVVYLFT